MDKQEIELEGSKVFISLNNFIKKVNTYAEGKNIKEFDPTIHKCIYNESTTSAQIVQIKVLCADLYNGDLDYPSVREFDLAIAAQYGLKVGQVTALRIEIFHELKRRHK